MKLSELNAIIRHYGTVEKAATALGVSVRSLYRWRAGKPILYF